jgi:hypothetical protein
VWGVAQWVDRVHGVNGWVHIAMERDWLLAKGELDGVALWKRVQRRWEELQAAKGRAQ